MLILFSGQGSEPWTTAVKFGLKPGVKSMHLQTWTPASVSLLAPQNCHMVSHMDAHPNKLAMPYFYRNSTVSSYGDYIIE